MFVGLDLAAHKYEQFFFKSRSYQKKFLLWLQGTFIFLSDWNVPNVCCMEGFLKTA